MPVKTKGDLKSINIRPGVSILSLLRHLNYRPWFALAEFVDNSIQSAIDCEAELRQVNGQAYKLRVSIELDPTDGGRITIRDNAAGIHQADYARAFRPAEIPPERSGLSEFGMGMKSAACWFSPRWMVRTKALGENVERSIHFDISHIVRDDLEELEVQSRKADPWKHYTEIVLMDMYKMPQSSTIKKMKDHIASIYRIFTRDGFLELKFDGEQLIYAEPKVLVAPHHKNLSGPRKEWRKEINFDFGQGLSAHGFAAIRETASVSMAGFALFRRKRLIQGSADDGYRPEFVFGKANSYRYQRLFGELHLEGFEVSHTKDGFKWDEDEDVFLELLRDELDRSPLPLLDQSEGYRTLGNRKELKRAAEMAAKRTAEVIEREVPPILSQQIETPPLKIPPPETLPIAENQTHREIDVELKGSPWRIILELSSDPSIGDWLTVSDKPDLSVGKRVIRQIGVRLALAHPFMERFSGANLDQIEPILRIAAAIGLAETAARDSGVRYAGTIRRNVNELLRNALSKP